MGTVYKKTATKPIPTGRSCSRRTASGSLVGSHPRARRELLPSRLAVDGTDRVVVTSGTYTANPGYVCEVSTGCRDEDVHRSRRAGANPQLRLAGHRDRQGRRTGGTLLSKRGVAPRTAQAAMRHSTIDLTMNVYTDPKLLDLYRSRWIRCRHSTSIPHHRQNFRRCERLGRTIKPRHSIQDGMRRQRLHQTLANGGNGVVCCHLNRRCW